jgi:large subunit ribosomal protein L29
MTVQRTRELRELGDEELNDQLVETKSELFNLRFQHVTGQLDNYARLGDLRRDVARITTLLREREIAAAEATPSSGAAGAAPSDRAASAAPSDRAASAAPSDRAASAAPSSGATETAAPASDATETAAPASEVTS